MLIMYDSSKRKKWGRYTNERRVFRYMVWTFVVLEAILWPIVGVYGLAW